MGYLDLVLKASYVIVVYFGYVCSNSVTSDVIFKSHNVEEKQISVIEDVGTYNKVAFGTLNDSVTCSDANKCSNGGLCFNNVCICLPGTSGPLCTDIDGCGDIGCDRDANAVCDYDTRNLKAYCKCKPWGQVFDYDDYTCKECMCDTCRRAKSSCIGAEKCEFIRGKKTCTCSLPFFKYNPKYKTCEECYCGEKSESCSFDDDGRRNCKCDYGYALRFECERCDCYGALDCEFIGSRQRCICGSGKEQYGSFCYPCTCGENGKCMWGTYRVEQIGCKCDPGYMEIDGVCQLIETCYCGENSQCKIENKQKICSCQDGFRNENGLCTDINECDNPKTCPKNMKCLNSIGSYNCTCIEGFRNSTNVAGECDDIDECLESKPCEGSELECFNTVGSFRCVCKPGYSAKEGMFSKPICESKSSWKLGLGLLTGIFIAIMIALIIAIKRKS